MNPFLLFALAAGGLGGLFFLGRQTSSMPLGNAQTLEPGKLYRVDFGLFSQNPLNDATLTMIREWFRERGFELTSGLVQKPDPGGHRRRYFTNAIWRGPVTPIATFMKRPGPSVDDILGIEFITVPTTN